MLRLSEKQYREITGQAAKRGHKYNARKCMLDEIMFDSAAEARYWAWRQLSLRLGEIKKIERQVPIKLPGNTTLYVDFVETRLDDSKAYIDVKGFVTAIFRLKQRQVKDIYNIDILTAKYKDGKFVISRARRNRFSPLNHQTSGKNIIT